MEKEMVRVMMLPAHGKAYVTEIENTLEAVQQAVGGYIETVRFTTDMIAVCDEEGLLKDKPMNRHIPGLVGDMFICGVDADDFCALTDGQIERLYKIFGEEEQE